MRDKQREKDTRIEMMMEDQRSRLAEKYFKECEQWERDAVAMRARGLEMKMGGLMMVMMLIVVVVVVVVMMSLTTVMIMITPSQNQECFQPSVAN
jgi:Flp pilus assembly protein TadB